MTEFQKVLLSGIGVILTSVLVFYFSGCSTIDFSRLKYTIKPMVFSEVEVKKTQTSNKLKTKLPEYSEGEIGRDKASLERRAKIYVQNALRDYYNGNTEEALRRLERAKTYDPNSYEALRLAGQIKYEQNRFRQAFNEWSKATQLPNDDKTMPRDLDVIKRLIRYYRYEMDRLQVKVHRNPSDLIAREKLKEIQNMMME